MAKTTQADNILQYMRDYGSITPMDAVREFGCYRLSARIFDLKERGHKIRTEMKSFKNRYGNSVTYAEYTLVKEA